MFTSDFEPVDGDYAVSFLNLIEIYVARFFRDEGVKPPVIRRAREILSAELSTKHPFAHADLRTDGARIIQKHADAEMFVDVITKQQFFGQMKLGRIKYGKTSRLAEEWGIAEGVVIRPDFAFGSPTVEKTAVSTLILAKQYVANHKDAALVARLFRVSELGVQNAYRFEHHLRRVA